MTRLVQFGSEPLFDSVLDPPVLGAQVAAAMKNLSKLQIQVDISELAYGWQEVGQSCLIVTYDDYSLKGFRVNQKVHSKSWAIWVPWLVRIYCLSLVAKRPSVSSQYFFEVDGTV